MGSRPHSYIPFGVASLVLGWAGVLRNPGFIQSSHFHLPPTYPRHAWVGIVCVLEYSDTLSYKAGLREVALCANRIPVGVISLYHDFFYCISRIRRPVAFALGEIHGFLDNPEVQN